MSCQSIYSTVERWQLAGAALAGASALELPYKALVENHPPLVLLLCSQGTSHTPAPCSQRHLDSLCVPEMPFPPCCPHSLAEEAAPQPWLLPGTSPSTATHPLSIGFSKCLRAVVLAFLSWNTGFCSYPVICDEWALF